MSEDNNFIGYIQSMNEDLMKPACQSLSLLGCLGGGVSDEVLREKIEQAKKLLAIYDFSAALAKYKEVES